MRNQYFGDRLDYIKYGMLRRLTGYGELSTAVCWMMRPDNPRNGVRPDRKTVYLDRPDVWRRFDAPLFDLLRDVVRVQQDRHVRHIEESGLLPNTTFYRALLPSDRVRDRVEREAYLTDFLENEAAGKDLVFFDPDTGIEVANPQDRYSYLINAEIRRVYEAGHSLLIFQHPENGKTREAQGIAKAEAVLECTGANRAYFLYDGMVGLILVPQPRHEEFFDKIIRAIQEDDDGAGAFVRVLPRPAPPDLQAEAAAV